MTTILVVEDESSFSEALEFLLGKEGFSVVLAATGNQAGFDSSCAGFPCTGILC